MLDIGCWIASNVQYPISKVQQLFLNPFKPLPPYLDLRLRRACKDSFLCYICDQTVPFARYNTNRNSSQLLYKNPIRQMKTQRTWPYLSLVALMGLAGCSTSRQTAQNTGEMDDLYASSSNAVVYEAPRQVAQATERAETPRAMTRQRERDPRNTNPDYATNDEQRGYDPNASDYYTELSTRNIKRGLSADPGWNNDSYNDGFTNGYYAGIGNPSYNSARWNPWGYGNGFNTGFSMGIGLGSAFGGGWGNPWGGGYNSWNRYGGGFYDPFYGGGFNSYAYNPWGYGGGFGGGFGSPYGYGYNSYYGGGYNSWGGYGGGYGGYGRPVIVNNTIVTGADPYRNNRTMGARGGSASNNRYNGDFNNTPRTTGNTGGRQANGGNASAPAYDGNTGSASTAPTNSGSSDGYYARPRQNSRGTYYYENGGSAPAGNTSRTSTPAPNSTYSNNNSGNGNNGGYYSAPRQNSRGTYSAPADNSGGNRSSQPSYQAPQQQQQQRSTYESRPSYQAPQQQSQPSYSAPSSDGGSRGGGSSAPASSGSSSGGGGGGSRGPR